MLTFGTQEIANVFAYMDKETSRRQFVFQINGMVHGQQVFSEVIFYMMKGGKLVNCLLGKINGQLLSEVDDFLATGKQSKCFPTHFAVKIKDLPKSFGCTVDLDCDTSSRSF